MFCTRKSSNQIRRIHEREMRIVNDDYESTFVKNKEQFLIKNKTITPHKKNYKISRDRNLYNILRFESTFYE